MENAANETRTEASDTSESTDESIEDGESENAGESRSKTKRSLIDIPAGDRDANGNPVRRFQ